MIFKNELELVSKMLNIKLPKLIYNEEMAFSYVPMLDVIFYCRRDYNEALFLFIHELRHKYQFIYKKNIVKDKYYLLSYHELDAYSYAYYIIKNIFKINYHLKFPLSIIIREYLNHYFIEGLI